MFFIINKLKDPVTLAIVKEEEKNRTALQLVTGDLKFDLFWAVEEELIEAFTKRFKVGATNVKALVNRHDFYVTDRLTVVGRPNPKENMLPAMEEGIKLTTIPLTMETRTEEERTMPRHVIVVLSKEEDEIQASLNDDRNALETASFVIDGYRFQVFTIKWSSWKALKHKAAIYVTDKDGNEQGFEFGVSPTNKGNRVQDDLILLTGEELGAFKAEQEDLKKIEEEAIAKKKAAAQAARAKNDRNYNNRQREARPQQNRPRANDDSRKKSNFSRPDNRGNNRGDGNYSTKYSDNGYGGNYPFNDIFNKGGRSGNKGRKNFGNGSRKHR